MICLNVYIICLASVVSFRRCLSSGRIDTPDWCRFLFPVLVSRRIRSACIPLVLIVRYVFPFVTFDGSSVICVLSHDRPGTTPNFLDRLDSVRVEIV